jgi:6-phosphogluconolactonase
MQGDARVAAYSVDRETGAWTLLQIVEVAPGAATWFTSAPIAITPDRRRLYVGMRGIGAVATYAINTDGRLNLLGTANIRGGAPFLSVDLTGRWLLAAYIPDGKVTVHRIDENGIIIEGPVQELSTAARAHAIIVDQTNRFAFVPHTEGNVIFQFRFNQATGSLEPNEPPAVRPPAGTAPRHYRFHPRLNVAYFINEAKRIRVLRPIISIPREGRWTSFKMYRRCQPIGQPTTAPPTSI